MKNLFKNFPEDRIIAWGFNLSIFFILGSILITLVFYRFLPPFLPVYNKMPWGYARVGSKIEFFIPIAIALALYIVNFILSSYLYKKVILLARFLAAATVLLSASILIFV